MGVYDGVRVNRDNGVTYELGISMEMSDVQKYRYSKGRRS